MLTTIVQLQHLAKYEVNTKTKVKQMAYYSDTYPHSPTERFLEKVARLLERTAARHAHYRIYRESLRELQALNDRDLNDLGLNRTMLKDLAMQSANNIIAL